MAVGHPPKVRVIFRTLDFNAMKPHICSTEKNRHGYFQRPSVYPEPQFGGPLQPTRMPVDVMMGAHFLSNKMR
jgi:hypothetical protein